MALLILQDRLSTSSLSSISSSSGYSSNSSSARDKPLLPILDADFAPPQEAKLEFESFIPIQCTKGDDEDINIVKRDNFRQRMKRIFFKHSNEPQDGKPSIFDTKLRRRSAPVDLTLQPTSPMEEQHPIQQERSGLRRWRSALNRNSISTDRQASEMQAARLARSHTPRRRALSEDNGRLEIHMADRLDCMYEHAKDSSARKFVLHSTQCVSNIMNVILMFTISQNM